MSGLDWPGLMRAGLQVLRLPPDTFWALTPAELQVMLGQGATAAPMLQDGLARMMVEWPDEGAGNGRAPRGD